MGDCTKTTINTLMKQDNKCLQRKTILLSGKVGIKLLKGKIPIVRMDMFYTFHDETSLHSSRETSWKYALSILIPWM